MARRSGQRSAGKLVAVGRVAQPAGKAPRVAVRSPPRVLDALQRRLHAHVPREEAAVADLSELDQLRGREFPDGRQADLPGLLVRLDPELAGEPLDSGERDPVIPTRAQDLPGELRGDGHGRWTFR